MSKIEHYLTSNVREHCALFMACTVYHVYTGNLDNPFSDVTSVFLGVSSQEQLFFFWQFVQSNNSKGEH